MFRLSVFISEYFLNSANVAISVTNSSTAGANVTGDERADRAANSHPWSYIKKYFELFGCLKA